MMEASASSRAHRVPVATYYHPLSRVWMVAGRDVALVQLCAQLNPDRTDGHTHTAPVTCVLYNPLFKVSECSGPPREVYLPSPCRVDTPFIGVEPDVDLHFDTSREQKSTKVLHHSMVK